jgi:type II secretory pathway pseudopilin PulG
LLRRRSAGQLADDRGRRDVEAEGSMTKPDEQGITMVELMVAMLLMAVALLVLAASFPYALYGVMVSGLQTTATLLAQEAIERAKATDYGSIPGLSFDGSSGPLPGDCAASGSLRPVPAFSGFARCVAVQAGAPSATTTTITAVVEFTGGPAGSPGRTTVTTIRAH